MKILILDGANQNTLAITRYLGKRPELILHVVGYNKLSISCYSKYTHKKIFLPSPKKQPVEFYYNLIQQLKEEKYDLLMPVGFVSFEICMQHEEEIKQYTKVILTNKESFSLASNKLTTYRFAQENGIPCPKTYFLNFPEEIKSLEVPYPIVIKAPFEMGKNVVEYAYTREEMISKFETMCRSYGFKSPDLPVVQQFINGDGFGFFAYYENGECIQKFMHKRIREYPVSGGASVCAESFYDKQLDEQGRKMLNLVRWNGVAMVEFKKHTDGEYKLMEINPKFWGSLELALAAGIDFPYCIVQKANGESVPKKEAYSQVRFQWLLNGELFHFFSHPSSFFSIIGDMFSSKKDLRLSDPMPNLIQFVLVFLHIYKKITGKT
ncbi:MAG TPA: ATP-grasp domain-containing protein [Nitrosopumilaceae archaeon]|jgi:predicted ATP-grasp superfamily ATP-dependent carboligase|nr:ATP-grasp domain-containing protein [Nitrosopumilaceae archaeon]